MSQLADIKTTLSNKWLRDKLTINERAKLLVEIISDIGYDYYEREDEDGEYLEPDFDKAIEELDATDAEAIKNGW